MHRFITHESIAEGYFNTGFCGAAGNCSGWSDQLVNTEETVMWMCKRLKSDYANMNVKMRRAFGSKDVEPLIP